MRRTLTWSLCVLLSACQAQIAGAPTPDAAAGADAPPVIVDGPPAPPVDAPPLVLGPWATPQKIAIASSGTLVEDDVTLSSNTLELFFAVTGANGKDLFYSTRPTVADPWTPAVSLSFNTATQSDETPRLSADDKTLYFASARGGNGTLDIYQTTRDTVGSTAWGPPTKLDSSVNTTGQSEKWFMPCDGNRYVMVQGANLVEGIVGGAPPVAIAALNLGTQTGTFLTPDCLTVHFASQRSGATRLYRATRENLVDPWPAPTQIDDFTAAGGNQEDPWLSSDARTFAFASDASGTKDLYLSTRALVSP